MAIFRRLCFHTIIADVCAHKTVEDFKTQDQYFQGEKNSYLLLALDSFEIKVFR